MRGLVSLFTLSSLPLIQISLPLVDGLIVCLFVVLVGVNGVLSVIGSKVRLGEGPRDAYSS